MASSASALDFPLHPNSVFWLTTVQASSRNYSATLAARVLRRPRPQVAMNRFVAETNTVRLDRRSAPRPRCCQTWEANVRVNPLALEVLAGDGHFWRQQCCAAMLVGASV